MSENLVFIPPINYIENASTIILASQPLETNPICFFKLHQQTYYSKLH